MKVVFACGRMNPPTLGHARLVNEVKTWAAQQGGEAMIFTTKTHDADRNPLTAEVKKTFAESAFGMPVTLTTSPYTALEELVESGVRELTFVVGEDRLEHFGGLAAYAAKLGVDLKLHSIARSETSESATKARDAVLRDDKPTFCALTPSPHEGYQDELFRAVRRGLQESHGSRSDG